MCITNKANIHKRVKDKRYSHRQDALNQDGALVIEKEKCFKD